VSLRPLKAAVETWAPGRGIAADPLHRISATWPQIVGANVAKHSEPLALNGETLLVATRSSAWSQQLQLLSPTILRGIAALPDAVVVNRLAFRSGALRRLESRGTSRKRAAAASAERGAGDAAPGPAADAAEALERLRRRLTALRARAGAACAACGAPLEGDPGPTGRCAPCDGDAERDRMLLVERTIYLAPWLTHAELREQIPDLSGAEFERARRVLLQRWWLVLDRIKRGAKVGASGDERQVASSFVLLQSRLPPDRITPAIVRNAIGDDVTDALWPNRGERADSSNKSVR
jgi:hypothetical protein